MPNSTDSDNVVTMPKWSWGVLILAVGGFIRIEFAISKAATTASNNQAALAKVEGRVESMGTRVNGLDRDLASRDPDTIKSLNVKVDELTKIVATLSVEVQSLRRELKRP